MRKVTVQGSVTVAEKERMAGGCLWATAKLQNRRRRTLGSDGQGPGCAHDKTTAPHPDRARAGHLGHHGRRSSVDRVEGEKQVKPSSRACAPIPSRPVSGL